MGSDIRDASVYVTVDQIDFRLPGLKEIRAIEIGANFTANYQAAIRYKFDDEDTWEQTDWCAVNDQGVAHIKQSGRSFEVLLRSLNTELDPAQRVEPPDYITIRYESNDKRQLRGLHAGKVAS